MVLPPIDLRCEYLFNPLGVDKFSPRLSWILQDKGRGEKQSAFQIIVSSEKDLIRREIGDIWDSGRIESERTYHITYAGRPLRSGKRYYWRVRWWNKGGRRSPYSEISFFEMGLLSEKDWQAKWISKKECLKFSSHGSTVLGKYMGEYVQTYALYLRKEFETKRAIRRARIYVCGLGYYEARLNGQKIGDHLLDPGQTDYHKIALYSTYDITPYIQKKNAIGIVLGNGRHIKYYGYTQPKMILQIEMEYKNGELVKIVSDETWKVSHGPLKENGLYFGERYDARLKLEGWDDPGFDDSSWETAVLEKGPALSSQMIEPIRVSKRIKPVKLWSPKPGIFIYDFGQNFSGWVKIMVQGLKGTEIKLRHAELINEDGTLNTAPNQNAESTDIYILKGEDLETFEPRFTYHGFRYVEVTGFPGVPTLENIEGTFVHTDVQKTGDFFCSNDLINRIHRNILWGQLSNLMSIPTDCPQRDERHGWLGDAHLSAEEAIHNFGMAAFYTKFLEDIRHAQKEDGSLPDVVPPYLEQLYPADPAWGAAYPILAWMMYTYYEDTRILEEHYPHIKKYVEFLTKNAAGNIISNLGKYGDWCPPGSVVPKRTPVALTSNFYYYQDALLVSRMAEVLGKEDEAKAYSDLAQEIKQAFNRTFLEEEEYAASRTSLVDKIPSQTSNTLPLALDIVPKEKKAKVLERLLHNIVSDQDLHLDTGILGTRYILDVLTENGYEEIAYKLATQRTYPGWGYMIEEGASTLWERWEKISGGGMNSHNHIMLGSVDAWFYRTIAGVRCLEPGWKKIAIKPPLFEGLNFAAARLKTIRGEIRLSWQRLENSFELIAQVPVGSEAEVFLPLLFEEATLREGKKILWKKGKQKEILPEILFSGRKGEYLIFQIGSGYYSFRIESGRSPH